MKKIVLVFLFSLTACVNPTAKVETTTFMPESELPVSLKKRSEVLLNHEFLKISYNVDHKLPNWVFYKLTSEHLKNRVAKRKSGFSADPRLITLNMPYLFKDGFKGGAQKYDIGHMAPSADFLFSKEANAESFFMSNTAPQAPQLNRVAWEHLEELVRGWACSEGELFIVVGPILQDGLTKLPSGASIPQKFFKVILDNTPPRKSIAFVFSQDDHGKQDYKERAMSMQELEKLTGYDFFTELPVEEKKQVESSYNLKDWHETKCYMKSKH
jgi:endonuclease G